MHAGREISCLESGNGPLPMRRTGDGDKQRAETLDIPMKRRSPIDQRDLPPGGGFDVLVVRN